MIDDTWAFLHWLTFQTLCDSKSIAFDISSDILNGQYTLVYYDSIVSGICVIIIKINSYIKVNSLWDLSLPLDIKKCI